MVGEINLVSSDGDGKVIFDGYEEWLSLNLLFSLFFMLSLAEKNNHNHHKVDND